MTQCLPDTALEALGALGLVDVVPHLLRAMEHPALAAAAGVAFARMTAATGIAAAEAPPAPADSSPSAEQPEQGAEALPEPEPPLDPAKAAAWWKENADRFAPDKRWQAGIDVTGAATDRGLLDRLPLAIRRDEYLRGRAAGGQVPDLELEACATFRAGPV